jgi:hypothetical protein
MLFVLQNSLNCGNVNIQYLRRLGDKKSHPQEKRARSPWLMGLGWGLQNLFLQRETWLVSLGAHTQHTLTLLLQSSVFQKVWVNESLSGSFPHHKSLPIDFWPLFSTPASYPISETLLLAFLFFFFSFKYFLTLAKILNLPSFSHYEVIPSFIHFPNM